MKVFDAGENGIGTYRIPTAVTIITGCVLAICKARKANWRDKSATILVLKRSMNVGKTWGPMKILHDADHAVAMDPTPVADRTTGRVWRLRVFGTGSSKRHRVSWST